MESPRLTDELATLKNLLERLESGSMTMRSGGKDVTQREVGILRKEIAAIEKTLARLRGTS
jgi:hypothetical protein